MAYVLILRRMFSLEVHLPIMISRADALSPPEQLKQCTAELSFCRT